MKKVILPLVALLALMSCDESTNFMGDEAQTMDGRVVADLHGVVSDNASGERLSGVEVTTVIDGRIATNRSNGEGYYVFSNLATGQYELTFDRSGYAMHYQIIDVPSLDELGVGDAYTNEDYPISLTQDVNLLPLSSGLQGRVYLRTAQGEEIPVQGVTVQADFSSYPISPRTLSTQTAVNGSFAFEELPAAGNIYVHAMQFSDGDNTWLTTTAEIVLYPGYTSSMSDIVMVLED